MIKRLITCFLILAAIAPTTTWAQCVTQLSYTMTPPPVNGQYQPGQTVEICASLQFTQNGAIWFHGIVPEIPPGWDVNSISVQPPASCSGSGVWGWYNSVTGNAATAGTWGPGIFYDQGNDGNPGNNYGDSGFSCNYTWDFCMTITVTDDCQGGALDDAPLDIDFTILGDNSSGSWSNNGCNPALDGLSPPPALSATLNCCSGEDVAAEVCSSDPNLDLYSLFNDTPAGGTWEDPQGNPHSGTFEPGADADGTYTYNFSTPDCSASSTVEVTTAMAPNAGNGQNITTCESGDPIDLDGQIVGGDAGGTWTDPQGDPFGSTFTPGTDTPGLYTYSVGDGQVCPVSQTVVNVTVEPDPFAGDDGAVTLCQSDPDIDLFNFLLNNPEAGGSWTDPSGNPFSGTLSPGSDAEGDYTYTVGTPPCATSATVTVTIVPLPFAGDDAGLTLCENDAEIDLFTLLPGADAGGFWADPNNAGFDGLFTPGVDPDGDYIYQVGGAACNDQAVISVTTLTPPSGTIVAPDTYCQGEDITITFELTGSGPFDVTYALNNSSTTLSGILDGHTETITSVGSADLVLLEVVDSSPQGCTASGNSVEVEMINTPTATIVGGGGICETEDAVLTFELSGTGPFDVVYTDGTTDYTLNGISDGHTENVAIANNTTFTLVSVTDGSPSACPATLSGSASFAVNPAPAGTISGSTSVCLGESTDLTFELDGNAPFDVVYTDGADNYTLTGIEDGHTVSVSPQFLSFFELVSVISQGNPGCPGTTDGLVQISVSVPPVYNNLSTTCNDANEGYVVSFEINGGNPNSYIVDGDPGTLNGNVFTSEEIPTGGAYTFLLDDGNGCGPVEIEGQFACDCTSNAGTMQADSFELCTSETATANHNGNAILDGNDVLYFVLHDAAGDALGNVVAVNTVPEFGYTAGMDLNTTYYISAVVGNDDGGAPDYNDPCLSVSEGVELTFIPSPTATISGSGAICPGESATLQVALTGTGPWDVAYAIDGDAAGSFQTDDANHTLDVDEGGTYTLLSVSDATCSGTTDGAVDVTAFEVPTADISSAGNYCSGSGDGPEVTLTGQGPWTFNYTIDNGDPQTVETDQSPYTIAANSSGSYAITALADANCSGAGDGPVDVTILDNPVASISGGGQICEGTTGTISFSGAGTGVVSVSYALDGVAAGTINLIDGGATLETDAAGTYTITGVADEFCTGESDGSSTTLVVNPIPNAVLSLSPSTLCAGDSALLSIALSGNGPFNLVYSNGDELLIEDDISGVNTYIQPEDGQEINLISIADASDPSCSQNLDQSVVAEVLPVPQQPALDDLFRCNNDTFPQIGVEPEPGLSYLWIPAEGLTNAAIANPVLNLENESSEEQTYTYTLSVSNGTCGVSNSMEVTINPGPNVDFSYQPDPVTTDATTVNFINQTAGSDLAFSWTVDSLPISTSRNFIYEFPQGVENKYAVTLWAQDELTGCANTHTEIVAVVGELQVYVPNAFTPDGDGINDLFGPVVRNERPGVYEFQVFNRQGELVFQADAPDQKWDGSDPTQEYYVQDGVYVWILRLGDRFSSNTEEHTGSVTVLR